MRLKEEKLSTNEFSTTGPPRQCMAFCIQSKNFSGRDPVDAYCIPMATYVIVRYRYYRLQKRNPGRENVMLTKQPCEFGPRPYQHQVTAVRSKVVDRVQTNRNA